MRWAKINSCGDELSHQDYQGLLALLKNLTARFRGLVPTFDEIARTMEAQDYPGTAEDVRDIQSRIGQQRLPRDPEERQRLLFGAVSSALYGRQQEAYEARAAKRTRRPLVSGAEIMRQVAEKPYLEYSMRWSQQADAMTLIATVHRFGQLSLDLDARLEQHGLGEIGTVRFRLNVDRLESRVEFADLHGNGQDGLHQQGLGRFLTDLGNRILKQTLPGHARVYGRAFNTEEDCQYHERPGARPQWIAGRQRRIDFWRNAGAVFTDETVKRYLELEILDAPFTGTVADLVVRTPAGEKLFGRFDMFPPLCAFSGEPPIPSKSIRASSPAP